MSPTHHSIPNISLERPRTQGEGKKGERDVPRDFCMGAEVEQP